MDAVGWALVAFIIVAFFEALTIGVIFTRWGREQIIRRVLRLAKYGDKKWGPVLNEVKREWKGSSTR